ncbi:MAG: hypothetical protein JW986_08230 [Methanotrichaceae archaeon]|nr:hypothetical protein [Methanotrichaceae archaeon]
MNLMKSILLLSILCLLPQSSWAFSFGASTGGASTFGACQLDTSAGADLQLTLGEEKISGSFAIEAPEGDNSLELTTQSGAATVTSGIDANGALSTAGQTHAGSGIAYVAQSANAVGAARMQQSASDYAKWATQRAQLEEGALSVSQQAIARDGDVRSAQVAAMAGFNGGLATDTSGLTRGTVGMNGAGAFAGYTATDGGEVAGAIEAQSSTLAAFAAGKAGSDYSYVGAEQLSATFNAGGDGAETAFDAKGGETTYAGEVTDEISQMVPTPGTWVNWGGDWGIASRAEAIQDDLGNLHVFAVDGDTNILRNTGGDWYQIGTDVVSNPNVVEDGFGRIHVQVVTNHYWGVDIGAMYDYIFNPFNVANSHWVGLPGAWTSDPDAVLQYYPDALCGDLAIVGLGYDNNLWLINLAVVSETSTLSSLGGGGNLKGNPHIVRDPVNPELLRTFVRTTGTGIENHIWQNMAVWDDGSSTWVNGWDHMNGICVSDVEAVVEGDNVRLLVNAAEGLYMKTIDNTGAPGPWEALTTGIGGSGKLKTPTASGMGVAFTGTPDATVDQDGLLHIFAVRMDATLRDCVYNPATGTHQWYATNGGMIESDPSVITMDDGRIFAAVKAIGDLWVNWFGAVPV